MRMEMNLPAAWALLLAGEVIYAAALAFRLRKQGALRTRTAWSLLLPAALGLALSRGGFELLQIGEGYAGGGWSFRWCYSLGLAGMIGGTALCARISRTGAAKTLDGCAAALCLAMALARCAQRWLGETGIGPILDEPGIMTMLNDWDEPVLATWMIETIACLIAAGCVLAASRRSPRRDGGTLCLAIFAMLIPQILIEQYRSGFYLRFMMMRLEQALFAVFALAALIRLCAAIRRAEGIPTMRAFGPVWLFIGMAGVIAAVQFILDGKLIRIPTEIAWMIYMLMIDRMLSLCVRCVRRADRAGAAAEQRNEGKEITAV